MKMFEVAERQATLIPVKEILDANGVPKILSAVKEKGYFDIDFRGNQLAVVAGKYIGQIPINENVVINVKPKLAIKRLTQILEKANEPLKCLGFYSRNYQLTNETSKTIFEALVSSFAESLKVLVQEGVYRKYRSRTENISSLRGRVNFAPTFRNNHARGIFHKAVCTYFELTNDHALNRLLKYGIWYSAQHLLKMESKNHNLIRLLDEFYDYFAPIQLDHSLSFVEEATELIKSNDLLPLRSYYLSCCDICLAILGRRSVELIKEGEDISVSSFLLDMESVFEQYIRNVLSESRDCISKQVTTLDGNKSPGKGWLLRDTRKFDAKPDLVVSQSGRFAVIGDVKYKPKLAESDRYQVIAHALSYGAKSALLVFPCPTGETSGIERLGRVGGENGVNLFIYRYNLEANDLLAEESKFSESVCELSLDSVPKLATSGASS